MHGQRLKMLIEMYNSIYFTVNLICATNLSREFSNLSLTIGKTLGLMLMANGEKANIVLYILASGSIATPARDLCALLLLVFYMQCSSCSRYKAEFEGLWLPRDCRVYVTQLHGDQHMYY